MQTNRMAAMSGFFHKPILVVGLVWILITGSASHGQSLQVQLANLRADMDRLNQIVRRMQLQIEDLERENGRLRELVDERTSANPTDRVSREELTTVLSTFERRIQAANRQSRDLLVDEVSKEIEALAEQTQKAITTIADGLEGAPTIEQVVVFNDNYPKTGTTYTVVRGDSLGKIARDMKSRVPWIRNANRLSSDIIYPGQELFIPQED